MLCVREHHLKKSSFLEGWRDWARRIWKRMGSESGRVWGSGRLRVPEVETVLVMAATRSMSPSWEAPWWLRVPEVERVSVMATTRSMSPSWEAPWWWRSLTRKGLPWRIAFPKTYGLTEKKMQKLY
ncbi:pentatricopeptide repeat-containing protein [Pyrus ussuriensis x Pyrus communis]|uniref:Pentatricopeptide repeat-containing protein n=1 Tax=Pyrus ussuriensis x Pyrus communis TaxID=2448454 RepID=A0A5N5F4F6_9ROSA|nr:pentatricopeptide repeat-containing protein [Pyrus ussuriensis x Pyrus communis]